MSILDRCLADLERRIDPDEEERLLRAWTDFSAGKPSACLEPNGIFAPCRSRPNPPGCEWPAININDALQDYDLMALQQFGACSALLAEGGGLVLNVRSNYGSSILPMLFGVEPFVMARELETLPTSRPLNDLGAIQSLIDAGVPDLDTGYGRQVLDMGERFMQIARRYPKIGRYIFIYHPDLQGPMDACEVIWGSTLFYAAYDRPELVHALLDLVTCTYSAYLRRWLAVVPFRPGGNVHWGLFHLGNLMLRDDSAMNFSRRMFDEFIGPYDQRLLDEFGGGAIHFCGKCDHYIPSLASLRGLHAINMSQPELNNMEIIYQHTVDRGIKLLNLKREAAEAALARGRDLRGQVHCE
jgi:hypothetical protein